MSIIASIAIPQIEDANVPLGPLTELWPDVRTRFFRFLEKLPDAHDDIDLEVFRRVPVPI